MAATWLASFVSLVQQPAAPQRTLGELLWAGGPVMIPIGICSVVALGFALERYLRLTRRRVLPRAVDEVVELVRAGRSETALAQAFAIDAAAGRILAAGLRRRGFALREVEQAMEDQGRKELEELRAHIRPISVIANVTPLLGLLGTVLGIAEAFHRVVSTGMGKPENLAAGIEQALTTTIAGLVVAIPAMLVAAHLVGRARRLMMAVDTKLSPLVEQLAARPGGSDAA